MFQMNQFINLVRQGYSPQQLVMNYLETQMKGTPMGDNLIALARQGNSAEIEKIARNMASQRGIDFDKEFSSFRRQFGL